LRVKNNPIYKRIGRQKKTLFDHLIDNRIINTKEYTSSDINLFNLLDALSESKANRDTRFTEGRQKTKRIELFKERAQERKRNDRPNHYKFTQEQKLKIANYLTDLSKRLNNAAKKIKHDAINDPNPNQSTLYIIEENLMTKAKKKKQTPEERKQIEQSIFGNVIKSK